MVFFSGRVIQIGGIDPKFKDSGTQTLAPLQNYLGNLTQRLTPYPQSALFEGIVLGEGQKIPYTLKHDLKSTSTIHIVVVSGQNLTILAGFVMGAAGWIGRRKAIYLTLSTMIFYALLTGFQVPVVRALMMVSLAYLGQLTGRDKTGWWILMLTGAAMLLYNPNYLLNISFQLSFLATFGVVVVSPLLEEGLQRLLNLVRQDLAVTLAAQAMVLPVIAYNFGQISLVGVAANLLVLWTIPLIMIGGAVSLLVGLTSTFWGTVTGLLPTILVTYLIDTIRLFAGLPLASFRLTQTPPVLWAGYYLLLAAVLWTIFLRQERAMPTPAP